MAVFALAADPDDFDSVVNLASAPPYTGYVNSWVRTGYIFNGSTEDAGYIQKNFSSAQSTFWTHFCYGTNYNNYFSTRTATNAVFIKFFAGGVNRFGFRFTSTSSNVIEALQWTGSAWSSLGSASYGSTTGLSNGTDPWQIDIFIDIPNGRISLYRQTVPILSLTGLSISGAAVDRIRLGGPTSSYLDGFIYSELCVADWNTMRCRVVSKAPTGNGNYTEWTGAGYTSINEIQANGSALMTSATANQRQGVVCNTWPALGTNENIEYVQINTISSRDAAGPANQNVYWRISATDYNDTDTAVNISSTKTLRGFSASPAGGAWTPTILNSAEVGVRSRT